MLLGKKQKIHKYLMDNQASHSVTPFDTILEDHLSGVLKDRLQKLNMRKIEVHIDWLADYKCINIQGKIDDYYFDIQVEPVTYSIAYAKDEPEDGEEFSLEDATVFYEAIENTVRKIKSSK